MKGQLVKNKTKTNKRQKTKNKKIKKQPSQGKVVQSDVSFKSPRWEASHQQVALLVQRQVVGSGEAALAVGTLERLHARVLAKVSGEFV